MHPTIQALLSTATLGEPQVLDAMAVVPVVASLAGPDYVTLADAIAANSLVVTEVDAGGHVPELRAKNSGDIAILVLDGEELRGAKQNRILNTSILIGAGAEVLVPVSCTEQGRWRYESRDFKASGHSASSRIRHRNQLDVSRSLAASGAFRSDQSAVWNEVELMAEERGVDSDTGAMRDVYEQSATYLDRFAAAFPVLAGQNGAIVLHAGRVVGMDLISDPAAYGKVHDKLMRSYAMDTTLRGSETADKSDPLARAKRFFVDLAELTAEAFPSVALGESVRYSSAAIVGSALVVDAVPVHAAFFANDAADDGGRCGRMADFRSRQAYRTID